MTLEEFLTQIRTETRERREAEGGHAYSEIAFAERAMEHMAEIGMTSDPVTCHFSKRIERAELRLSGYAVSDDSDRLDLFVSLYSDSEKPVPIPDSETKMAAERCFQFLSRCAEGDLASRLDESNEAKGLAETIRETFSKLDHITIHVLTDRIAKSKSFKSREVGDKTIRIEVMDIERLYRHLAEGKPRDEVVIDFRTVSGGPLPCVLVPGKQASYSTTLTAIPGDALRVTYERFGARLLEANVRSFLSATGKVNKGIRDTLRQSPGDFAAFNNGVVIIADEAGFERTADGGPGLAWLRGVQVVNGGQTTASIYFTKKKAPETDLRYVRIPAKIIVIAEGSGATENAREDLVANISRFANSQNAVKVSDLSANRPFHRELERLSQSTYCSDGSTRWFYERAAGSFTVMLARQGDTPARLKRLRTDFPRRINKTDLARCLMAWAGRPDIVSQGLQKNFEAFSSLLEASDGSRWPVESSIDFKRIIAQAIVYRSTQGIVRDLKVQAFQANVIAYTVALLGTRFGNEFDLDQVWTAQTISHALGRTLRRWVPKVELALRVASGGRMISEWAKKRECWERVQQIELDTPEKSADELRRMPVDDGVQASVSGPGIH